MSVSISNSISSYYSSYSSGRNSDRPSVVLKKAGASVTAGHTFTHTHLSLPRNDFLNSRSPSSPTSLEPLAPPALSLPSPPPPNNVQLMLISSDTLWHTTTFQSARWQALPRCWQLALSPSSSVKAQWAATEVPHRSTCLWHNECEARRKKMWRTKTWTWSFTRLADQ